MKATATKRLYLIIVMSASLIAIVTALARSELGDGTRAILTIALALALSVRFYYVIGLLTWPPTPLRLALLLAFWCALVNTAWQLADPLAWGTACALLFGIGITIEIHNLVTRQWEIGSTDFQHTLRNDVFRGIASATFATIAVLFVIRGWPAWTPALIGVMIVADVLRLTEMIARHRRITRSAE
jgi:hypothetical protein